MPYAPDLAGCALHGRYELHELIGEGTFGRVYRGYDRRLARPVAIKVIKPWWAEDPEGAESFEREAQLLARVSAPGIVQIFDVGQAEEGLYFVTELVDGESLAARLKRGGPLDAWEACDIAEQLCRALEHAHVERIVHRDIKPANVLISARGRVKVGDLGIARLAEGSTDGGTATIVGTPRYMAPEQANGSPVTPATDVYSAGIVLYEMLAGRTPFGGESAVEIALQHVNREPPPLPPGTPPELGEVIARALAKDPADRYQSAAAMADALAEAREAAGTRRMDVPPPGPEWWELPTEVRDAPSEILAGDTRTLRPGGIDPTRPAPRMTPRRNANPAARRRAIAIFALALAVLGAMLVAARALTAPPTVAVPRLTGLTARQAGAKLHRTHLRAAFVHEYATMRPGIAFAQAPAEGATVKQGSAINVSISKGPAPVTVPSLTKQTASSATAALRHRDLKSDVSTVPAPGVTPGVVVRQSPTAGHQLKPGSVVQLFAAERPSWRSVTSFTSGADGGGHSVPFQIRGSQWRIVYNMSYDGTCNFVFFCNGPSAQVVGPSNQSFNLSSGAGETRVFKTRPGIYQINITAGWDSAGWSVEVEDWL